jgi:uncharacterized membrane protein YbaN (DUF454 family)
MLMEGYLRQTLKALRIALGVTLILVGIIGLFVPVLQGILFILLGLAILEAHFIKTFFSRICDKLKRK